MTYLCTKSVLVHYYKPLKCNYFSYSAPPDKNQCYFFYTELFCYIRWEIAHQLLLEYGITQDMIPKMVQEANIVLR